MPKKKGGGPQPLFEPPTGGVFKNAPSHINHPILTPEWNQFFIFRTEKIKSRV